MLDEKLIALLGQLKTECKAKVTGSYARGEQTEMSDLDIFIPETKWDSARRAIQASGLPFYSTAIGQLCLDKETPIKVEVSWRFARQAKVLKLDKVTIFDICFNTY
jgi:predicted nucleotidyltransferase